MLKKREGTLTVFSPKNKSGYPQWRENCKFSIRRVLYSTKLKMSKENAKCTFAVTHGFQNPYLCTKTHGVHYENTTIKAHSLPQKTRHAGIGKSWMQQNWSASMENYIIHRPMHKNPQRTQMDCSRGNKTKE